MCDYKGAIYKANEYKCYTLFEENYRLFDTSLGAIIVSSGDYCRKESWVSNNAI